MEYCRSFDLTSIGKSHFDLIFQYHKTNRWHSLKLSDDENTPGQVQYFLERYPSLDRFSELQFLSIVKMFNQYSLLSEQLSFLSNLVTLEIESVCGNYIPEFDLPALKKLTCSSCTNTSWLKVKVKINLRLNATCFFRIFLKLNRLNIYNNKLSYKVKPVHLAKNIKTFEDQLCQRRIWVRAMNKIEHQLTKSANITYWNTNRDYISYFLLIFIFDR